MRARAAASWLAGFPGDKVVFVGTNGWVLPAAIMASALCDRPFTPLNYRLSDPDLRKLLSPEQP